MNEFNHTDAIKLALMIGSCIGFGCSFIMLITYRTARLIKQAIRDKQIKNKEQKMKFCKDCKYCKKEKISIFSKPSLKFSKCEYENKNKPKIDKVTGEEIKEENFCYIYRSYNCGDEAKYFEPKEY